MRAMTLWKTSVVSISLFALLASGSLVKAARGQPVGWVRDASLAVAHGVDRVANLLSLNRPLDAANAALARDDVEPEIKFPPVTVAPVVDQTTTTLPGREISPDAPLRMRVFGDSVAFSLGTSLKNTASDDPVIHVANDARISTGLARPDYYNWPARMQEQLAQSDADTVVVLFGSNDDQSLQDREGKVVARLGTPEWEEEYRRRVAGVMDLVDNRRRKLVWVGMPVVSRPELNATLRSIDAIIADEAARRPWVSFVDLSKDLSGPNGEYVDYLTPPGGGATIRCRRPDGVHLTFDCLSIVSRRILGLVRPMYPVATTTTTTTTTSG
jgi:hypothetical protein